MHTTKWRLKPLICKQRHPHTVNLDQMSNHATSKTSSCYIPKLVSVSTQMTRVPKHNWPMCDRLPSELLSDAGLMRWRSAVAWLTASSNPLDAWSVSSSVFRGIFFASVPHESVTGRIICPGAVIMLLTISYRRPRQVIIIIWYWKQKPYAQHAQCKTVTEVL